MTFNPLADVVAAITERTAPGLNPPHTAYRPITAANYTVRVVLSGSCIERYVGAGGELTRDPAKAARLSREAAFPVAEHWRKTQPGACVDVFDDVNGEGRPVEEAA